MNDADRHYLEAVAAWDRDYDLRAEVRREFPDLDPWKQKEIVDQRRISATFKVQN